MKGGIPKISEAEYEIMKVIWKYAPISTNEVVEKLADIQTWNPKTIQTLLSRLVKKNAITYEKKGRVFVYSPIVEEKEYVTEESQSFLKRFYNGAVGSLVLNLIEQEQLTEGEIAQLKEILEQKQMKGE